MKNMIKLTDHTSDDIFEIFRIADELHKGKHSDILKGKSVILFFPESSIRTRVTFEKGIHLLGGQPILFPTESLDKKEAIEDVCGYLNNWADMVIARHKDISFLEKMSRCLSVPLINAMTSQNHPCEVLSDLYSLSKIRENHLKLKYLFCGANGNIGLAWKEAAEVLGFELEQCCPKGYEMSDIPVHHDLAQAIKGKDVICTDSLPSAALADFAPFQITESAMRLANPNSLLNPCPPFFRGEEVSADAIDSEFFVGYGFKKNLLIVQQAIMIYCLTCS